MSPMYRYHCLQLEILSYFEGDVRWLLKAPAHRIHLLPLLKQYPDARIVVLHRDPVEVIPSFSSLHYEILKTKSPKVDPLEEGRISLASNRKVNDAFTRARTKVPATQIHDLSYSHLLADPVGSVREIYHFAGDDFPDHMADKILRYLEEKPQTEYGRHQLFTGAVRTHARRHRKGIRKLLRIIRQLLEEVIAPVSQGLTRPRTAGCLYRDSQWPEFSHGLSTTHWVVLHWHWR